ncbi:MAG: FHA domain-containing protein [Planctomycetota bacterium]
MKASLVMFKADGTRRDFPLRPGNLVVGRKNSCELRIPLSSVSRQHCEVRVEGDSITLRDLGSSNGTYHNSIRVQTAELEAGDEIVVGPVVFTVVVNGVPAEIKPVRTIVSSADSHGSAATISPDLPVANAEIVSSLGGDDSDAATLDLDDEDDEPASGAGDDDDTDPIAALEAMASQEKTSGSPSDSSLIDFDFDDLTDDD